MNGQKLFDTELFAALIVWNFLKSQDFQLQMSFLIFFFITC